jgi:hypothetical protein
VEAVACQSRDPHHCVTIRPHSLCLHREEQIQRLTFLAFSIFAALALLEKQFIVITPINFCNIYLYVTMGDIV